MLDFFTLLILMVVIWTSGKVFRYLNLPVVFGELAGGIIVGPALLNLVPADSEMIRLLAEFGIFFLMLHTGLETNPDDLFEASLKSVLIAVGGVALPFAGGYFVSYLFGYPFITSLFIGMGLSVSAIAVAARLFKDCKIQRSHVASLTLGAAVIDDILALILFSVVLNLAQSGTVEILPLLYLLLKIFIFFGIVIYGGMKLAPLMKRVIYFGNKGFTLTLIIALVMGLFAEAIGLHMIIGAFLAGLFMREEVIDKKLFAKIEDRIYGMSYSFFGPIFFVSLAFHLDLTALKTAPFFLLAILLIAIFGKIIGAGGMAWLQRVSASESLAIGLAMNNRGAVELILASIGIRAGIIDETVFSILVLMAFATTLFSILSMKTVVKSIKSK